jgi:hypothetical protein
MNTPTHVIVSALALRADKHPERMWPAVVGGILPDATMFVFYGIQKLIFHTPERTIWEPLYFQPATCRCIMMTGTGTFFR